MHKKYLVIGKESTTHLIFIPLLWGMPGSACNKGDLRAVTDGNGQRLPQIRDLDDGLDKQVIC